MRHTVLLSIERIGIDVAIEIADEEDAIGNRGTSIQLGADQAIVQAGHRGSRGRVHHDHRVALRGRHHPRSRGRHRAEHRAIAHAVLPQITAIVRVDLAHATHATAPANRGLASSDVEIVAIPGTGRDGTAATLRAVSSGGHLVLPHRARRDVSAVKGVILAILVGHSHHGRAATGGEERGRRAEIAVAGPLGWR